jgi:hypothetical protein
MLLIIAQIFGLWLFAVIGLGLFGILVTRKPPVKKRRIYTVGAAGMNFHPRTGYRI